MKRILFIAAAIILISLFSYWLYKRHLAAKPAVPVRAEIHAADGTSQIFQIAADLKPIVNPEFFAINRPIPGLSFGLADTCRQGEHLVVMGIPRGPDQAHRAAESARRLPDQDGFRVYTAPLSNKPDAIRYHVFTDEAGDTVSVRDAGAWSANYEFEHAVAGRYLFRFLVKKECGSNFREFDRQASRFVNSMILK
ncbi:hypothetical protein WJ59_09730 [Burkholderia gladioli]|uniref:hypothetical protein n=2 Tax=Burkholderiaceae TaxID=119060 RepID=UPI000755C6F4|nr:hypothetical protein [Burkholderia gladioli]KVM70011.1 hypothetical protein WJ59_09730 [Burkholderia gladioli]NBI44125.1 hypothetical protein [Burkholderia sp. ISTR5]